MKRYMLEAHQGVSTEYPGNTLAAFSAAVRLGYDMIELDTKFTADNRCVILHDHTINRTARRRDGSKIESQLPISSLTLADALEYDYGIAMGEQFRGEKLPTLEEVLEFAAVNRILLKFDNVLQSHTEAQQETFFDTVERMGAAEFVGFTANSFDFIEKILHRFLNSQLHYDGPVTDENLARLSELVPRERVCVWIRFDNERTSWCKNPPVSDELAKKIHNIARLGVWLLTKESERTEALERYQADIIETDGSLKP